MEFDKDEILDRSVPILLKMDMALGLLSAMSLSRDLAAMTRGEDKAASMYDEAIKSITKSIGAYITPEEVKFLQNYSPETDWPEVLDGSKE